MKNFKPLTYVGDSPIHGPLICVSGDSEKYRDRRNSGEVLEAERRTRHLVERNAGLQD